MAKLPTAADVLGRVTPTSQAPVRVPEGVFGDYSGGYQAGLRLMEVGARLKDRDDTTEAQDLANQLNAARRELFDGTGDKPGYGSLKGKSALDDRERIEKEFERRREEILATASNDAVRRKATPIFDKQRETFLGRVAGHVQTQRDVWKQGVADASALEAQQNAIASDGAPGDLKVVWRINYKASYDKHGDPDVARSAAETAVSQAHIGVLNEMTINDPAAARKYFETNKLEIDRGEWKKLMPAIKDNEQNVLADADRRELGSQFDLTTAEGKRDAHAALDKKYAGQPEQLGASRTALEAAIKRAEDDRAETDAETIEAVRAKLYTDPAAALSPAELAVVQRTKGEMEWIKKIRKEGGRPTISDRESDSNMADFLEEYEKWTSKPGTTPTPKQFFKDWEAKLNPTHYSEARKKVDALRAAHRGAKVDAADTTVMTTAQRVKNALIQAGMDDMLEKASKRSEESKIAQAKFTLEIENLLRAEANKLKRELRPDEAQKIIDQAALNLVWVDSVLGSGDPRYPVISLTKEIIDGDDIYVPLEQLTQNEIKQFRDTLRQSGIYASDSNVEELAGAARMGSGHVGRWLQEKGARAPAPVPAGRPVTTIPIPLPNP